MADRRREKAHLSRVWTAFLIIGFLVGTQSMGGPPQVAPAPTPIADSKPRQVEIRARIVEVSYNKNFDLGFDWTYMSPTEVFGTGGDVLRGIEGIFPAAPAASESGLSFRFSAIDSDFGRLDASIRLLERSGYADILSRPTLITLEGVAARVTTGDQIPYRTVKYTKGEAFPDTAFIDAAVTLVVQPFILSNEDIQLYVNPKVSSVGGYITLAVSETASDQAPIISTREAETNVIVPNHGTLIIAGLMQKTKAHTENRVPFLGALPVIGWFFRSTSTEMSDKELFIIISVDIWEPHAAPWVQEATLKATGITVPEASLDLPLPSLYPEGELPETEGEAPPPAEGGTSESSDSPESPAAAPETKGQEQTKGQPLLRSPLQGLGDLGKLSPKGLQEGAGGTAHKGKSAQGRRGPRGGKR